MGLNSLSSVCIYKATTATITAAAAATQTTTTATTTIINLLWNFLLSWCSKQLSLFFFHCKSVPHHILFVYLCTSAFMFEFRHIFFIHLCLYLNICMSECFLVFPPHLLKCTSNFFENMVYWVLVVRITVNALQLGDNAKWEGILTKSTLISAAQSDGTDTWMLVYWVQWKWAWVCQLWAAIEMSVNSCVCQGSW